MLKHGCETLRSQALYSRLDSKSDLLEFLGRFLEEMEHFPKSYHGASDACSLYTICCLERQKPNDHVNPILTQSFEAFSRGCCYFLTLAIIGSCHLSCRKRQAAEQSSTLEVGNLDFHARAAASTNAFDASSLLFADHTIDTTRSLLSTSHTFSPTHHRTKSETTIEEIINGQLILDGFKTEHAYHYPISC